MTTISIKSKIDDVKNLIKNKELKKATEKLELIKNHNNPEVYFLLGSLYLNLKKIDLAKKNLQLASSLDNKNPRVFHNLGILKLLENKNDEAKSFFKEAYSKDPNYINSLIAKV